MPSSSLQGLNIVHPEPEPANDSQDLLSAVYNPDLTAQLDLWTNLNFQSDEPLVHDKRPSAVDDSGDKKNAVGGASSTPAEPAHAPAFDLTQFLSGFGIDPFQVPPAHSQPQTATQAATSASSTGHETVPSLAQLLALQPPPPGVSWYTPSDPQADTSTSLPQVEGDPDDDADNQPATKRARMRKTSVSSPDAGGDAGETGDPTSTPLTAAEDKRRRNTAASARFRLKKKEREAALERRAKELEVKVSELERECEGLRRENGWLKGLVVGVTGGSAAATTTSTPTTSKRERDDSAVKAA